MYCPECMVDVACADGYPCFCCGTTLHAHARPTQLTHDIRVFVTHDGDGYYAARSADEAMSYIAKLESGCETTTGVDELDLHELQEHRFLDENREPSVTFRYELDRIARDGDDVPCVFAWDASR